MLIQDDKDGEPLTNGIMTVYKRLIQFSPHGRDRVIHHSGFELCTSSVPQVLIINTKKSRTIVFLKVTVCGDLVFANRSAEIKIQVLLTYTQQLDLHVSLSEENESECDYLSANDENYEYDSDYPWSNAAKVLRHSLIKESKSKSR
jgi:hypothetical protein